MTDTPISPNPLIDLDSIVKPAVLAGILDIPVSMVYQGKQDGKLPAKENATYRESIQQYITFYKRKMNSRSTSMSEAKMAQDIRNGIAKEHQQWLEIKKTKEELVDIGVVKDLFEPVFQIIRSSLVNIARKHPEILPEIDNMMGSLTDLGHKIAVKAQTDANFYVQTMLDTDFSLQEAEEELEEAFEVRDE